MRTKKQGNQVVVIEQRVGDVAVSTVEHPPPLITNSGGAAKNAWRDFFEAYYPNPHTRRSYNTAAKQFCSWCEQQSLALVQVRAGDVGRYLRGLPHSIGSKKVHRAANKKLFDLLVERHVCLINPWSAARTEKYKVKRGKTPRIMPDEVSHVLQTISRHTPAGKRDHTIIGVLAGCGVRTQSIEALRRKHYIGRAGARQLQFVFKGGNNDTIEVRADLEAWIDDYLKSFGMLDADPETPFFRPFLRKTGQLRPWLPATREQEERGRLAANDVNRMVKRRFRDAEIRLVLSAHSFRVNAGTDLIEQGVPIEDVQEFYGHADARTTKVYDHSDRKVTRNLVERIRLAG